VVASGIIADYQLLVVKSGSDRPFRTGTVSLFWSSAILVFQKCHSVINYLNNILFFKKNV